jgi:hypothetical protein
MKNKRADIPVTILVIGIFAVCTLAIFSFYYSASIVSNKMNSVVVVETALVVEEQIRFYESVGKSSDWIRDEISEIEDIVNGKYIVEIEDSNVKVVYEIPFGK